MTIDWFTLVAEIVNFLILVWLLQRFLYRPIVNAMAAREQNIANRLQDAEEKNQQAEAEAERYHTLRQELEAERDTMLETAREEAEARRKDLIQKARAEVDEIHQNWHLAVQQQRTAFLNEVQSRIGESTVLMTQRVLNDIADDDLETRVVNTFLRQIRQADADTHEQIAAAFRAQTVEVDSAFALSDAERQTIETVLRDLTNDEVQLKYRVNPKMIYGVRLSTGDYEIAWNIGEYTSTLRDRFAEMIDDELDNMAVGQRI